MLPHDWAKGQTFKGTQTGNGEEGSVLGGVVVDRSGSWSRFSDILGAPQPVRKRLREAGGVERDE